MARLPFHHDPVDVLVIGSGIGGAIASRTLAEAGLKVVCLEQGDWTRPESRPHLEPDWEWRRLTSYSTAPNVRARHEDYPVDTTNEMTLMWNAVGGSTAIYTATWPRFRPSDFRKGTEHGCQPDWPFTYEDLEPWFEQNDADCGVSGMLGDPAIPPRGPFTTPPISHGAVAEVAGAGFEKLGWHWWTMPLSIISEGYDGRLACNRCGNCQSGCPRGSIADVSVTHWPKAIAAGAELRTNARDARIETDGNGRATGAVYIDRMTGTQHFQAAEIVIVAANGVGTPRLLLNSASSRFPNGLGNSSGLVGRHLMHHGLALVEIWTDRPLETHKSNTSAALICEEFAETDVARGFINGFTMHIVRMNGAGYQAHGSHSGNTAPWGPDHHRWFRDHFDRGFGVLLVGDDLPLAENRVTLSETLVDSDGLPAPAITYGLHPNDQAMMDYAVERALDLARAVDAVESRVNRWTHPERGYSPPAWHLLGTCRLGDDPRDSVVNQWGQSWDVPNLYIMDGSMLPTGGAVNPTSTMGAVILRAASHLRDRFSEARTERRTPAG
ncbi:MAG: GMC family oxidoreductase [Thermomicrobiales bacterium]|nr:GMC family oxidoreductase [Thermomicrobiales bacterium]